MPVSQRLEWFRHHKELASVFLVFFVDLDIVLLVNLACLVLICLFKIKCTLVARDAIHGSGNWSTIHQRLLPGNVELDHDKYGIT